MEYILALSSKDVWFYSVRWCLRDITDPCVSRTVYLVLVCAYLGYATYLGHHNGTMTQSIELIRRLELVQRRATKVILNLPFRTLTTYKQRQISLNLLPTGHLLARIS